MIWFKPLSSNQAWQLVVSIGLILLFTLIVSYLLELAGLTSRMPTPPGLNDWESSKYWLPLDGFLGVDGRWVGPFGHNTRGAMAATFIAVIGFAKINRASWVLIPGGFYFLLVFGVRAGFLSTFVGLLLVGLFSNNKLANRIPVWLKLGTVAFGTLFTAFVFSMSGAGTTGRAAIWPAFWDLIPEGAGALLGVGQLGIAEASELTRVSMDAHNIFLDALVRNGILGPVCLIVAIGLILSQSLRVAFMRLPGPLAVVSAYLVASMTDIQNDLFHSSYQLLLVFSASLTATLMLDRKVESRSRLTYSCGPASST